MSGNVNEWVYDIYRPLTYTDVEDLNPLRQTEALDPEGLYNQRQDLIGHMYGIQVVSIPLSPRIIDSWRKPVVI